jgi:hypothetical protein
MGIGDQVVLFSDTTWPVRRLGMIASVVSMTSLSLGSLLRTAWDWSPWGSRGRGAGPRTGSGQSSGSILRGAVVLESVAQSRAWYVPAKRIGTALGLRTPRGRGLGVRGAAAGVGRFREQDRHGAWAPYSGRPAVGVRGAAADLVRRPIPEQMTGYGQAPLPCAAAARRQPHACSNWISARASRPARIETCKHSTSSMTFIAIDSIGDQIAQPLNNLS